MKHVSQVIPEQVPQVRGNHESATKIAARIADEGNEATRLLREAENRALGAYQRAGLLKQALCSLRAVALAAQAAEKDLQVAYGDESSE
jgi:hypothetical protein